MCRNHTTWETNQEQPGDEQLVWRESDHRWYSPYESHLGGEGIFSLNSKCLSSPPEQYRWASLHAHLNRSLWCRGNWPHASPREMAELLCAILRIENYKIISQNFQSQSWPASIWQENRNTWAHPKKKLLKTHSKTQYFRKL